MICLSGGFGSPPSAQTCGQFTAVVVNGEDRAVEEEAEPSAGILGGSTQQSSASHCTQENEREVRT